MHPILFSFDAPRFLEFVFHDKITIYSYGSMIAIGALIGFIFTAIQGKKRLNIPYDTTNQLILYIMIASIIGGKLFVFFEAPLHYLSDPSDLLNNFSQGFVFYGSLIFAVPTMIIFFRKNQIPTLSMLDIMAITICIVYATGRIGCFFAGCCYGIPTSGPLGVIFTDPVSQAEPLNTPLHPTQLYSSIFVFALMTLLLILSRHKKFDGQIFLLYLMIYPAGRIIIEFFRGDISRGYLIKDVITNSQFISIIILITAVYFYSRLYRKSNISEAKIS